MIQSSCSVKNGKLNETIEVSALWSIPETSNITSGDRWRYCSCRVMLPTVIQPFTTQL